MTTLGLEGDFLSIDSIKTNASVFGILVSRAL